MFGTLEHTGDGRSTLRFIRTFDHPVDRVWRAVTEPEHLAAWFPTTIEGERAAGAPLHFDFPKGQAPPFDGEMIAYQPPSLVEFRWGSDVIRMEVSASAEGAVLTLLHTFDEHGKAARDAAGWHTCLDALSAALGGDAGSREAMSRWGEVHPHYVEAFGPEASTVGPPQPAG